MIDGISDKVVVITGASSGLGAATARLLSAGGARLVLGARRTDRISALANQLTQNGGEAVALGTDVTQVDPVRSIARLGDRPVLLIHGTADILDVPAEASEPNFHAALDAGVPVELQYCQGGTHWTHVALAVEAAVEAIGPL